MGGKELCRDFSGDSSGRIGGYVRLIRPLMQWLEQIRFSGGGWSHGTLSQLLNGTVKIRQESEQWFRVLGQEGGQLQPFFAQTQDLKDPTGILYVAHRCRGAASIATGAGGTPDQGDSIRAHFEGSKKERLADPARTWDAYHSDFMRNV